MPKRPTLPQKTPFGPLILLSSHAKWCTYRDEANDSLAWPYSFFKVDLSTQKIKIPTNHISDQRPCLLGYSKQSDRKIHQLSAVVTRGYSKQSHRKIRLLSGCHLLCRLKINRMLPTFQWISIETNLLNIFVLGKQDGDIVLVSF